MSDVLAIVIFVGAYVLIATEWVHRVPRRAGRRGSDAVVQDR